MSLKLRTLLWNAFTTTNKSLRFYSSMKSIPFDLVYPNSKEIKSYKSTKNNAKFSGYIPIEELDITYVRSGGAYGLKNATRVDLRFNVLSADWLSANLKKKLLQQYPDHIDEEGNFVIISERSTQALANTMDAMAKLTDIIYKLEEEPKEEPKTNLHDLRRKSIRERRLAKQRVTK